MVQGSAWSSGESSGGGDRWGFHAIGVVCVFSCIASVLAASTFLVRVNI